MGQYYKFMNIDKKEKCQRNWNGVKLTEHSYVGNNYCNDILNLLNKEWKGDRVIHIGDYANRESSYITRNKVNDILNELDIKSDSLYDLCDSYNEVKSSINKDIRYVYNLDKKEYIDLYKQPIQWCYCDGKKIGVAKFNSFALLTALGNGLGGGDYRTINSKYVGEWANDRLYSSDVFLEEYKDFDRCDAIFNEVREYDNISSFDDFDELLEIEKKIFKENINYFKKHNPDLDTLVLDEFSLLNEEKDAFYEILEQELKNEKELEINE